MYAFDYVARALASRAKSSAATAADAADANTTTLAALPAWEHDVFCRELSDDTENFEAKPAAFSNRLYLRLVTVSSSAQLYLVHNALPENLFSSTPSGTDSPASNDLRITVHLIKGQSTSTSTVETFNIYSLDCDDASATLLNSGDLTEAGDTYHGWMQVFSAAGLAGTPASDKYAWLYEFRVTQAISGTSYNTYFIDHHVTQLGTESLV